MLTEPPDDPLHPDLVAFASVKSFYFEHHANKIRSKAAAKRAFKLVSSYLGEQIQDAPKVGHFTLARQESFMVWCRDKHELSNKSISTYLSTIKAAFRFCSRPRIIKDARGREREARVLSAAPFVVDGEDHVQRVTGLVRSVPRHWIPQEAELAALIGAIEEEHVFRYVIMALNTWARPEAITELSVKSQVDFERGLVHLNPIGRPQNKKIRPTIRLTDNLRGWLLHWNLDRPLVKPGGEVLGAVNNRTLKAAAKRAGIAEWEQMTRYTFRHFMATRIRRVEGIEVTREQRAEWMGHVDPNHRTTEAWYESLDPDHLVNPARATDAIMLRLGQLCRKSLVSPNSHPTGKLTLLKSVGN